MNKNLFFVFFISLALAACGGGDEGGNDLCSDIITTQHGGKKLINIVCNNDFVCVYVSDNMVVVAGMGLGVLLVLIFWSLGIIGCVVLSRASGGLK